MDNKRLVFQPGNQWMRDTEVAPFYVIPGWWRRFIYHVLSAREFVVYTYLCGIFDRNAIAYPTAEQIGNDLGIKSRVIVARALDTLVQYGFILRGPSLIRGRLLSRRPVYQRPMPAYTLLKLMELNLIDENLFPKHRNTESGDFAQSAVNLGLQNLLGNDLFHAYEIASPAVRSAVLETALRQRVSQAVAKSHVRREQLSEDLPEKVSALINEDQGVPF